VKHLEIKNTAKKYIARMPEPQKAAVIQAIEGLKAEPPEGDIVPLEGQKNRQEKWRLRVGGHRVLFKIQGDTVFVTHVVPRGQAYTKKTIGGKK